MKTIIKALLWLPTKLVYLLYRLLCKTLPSRKTAYKMFAVQLVLLSFVGNVWFAKQLYVISCSAGGHFMTKAKCGELAVNQFEAQEAARVSNLVQVASSTNCIGNEDICN